MLNKAVGKRVADQEKNRIREGRRFPQSNKTFKFRKVGG